MQAAVKSCFVESGASSDVALAEILPAAAAAAAAAEAATGNRR